MTTELTRREILVGTAGLLTAGLTREAAMTNSAPAEPFRYCFNTSTIRGQKLPLTQVVEIAAKAGYQGIEPWIDEIEHYQAGGGALKDLGSRIRDLGLTVESGIGFAEWIVDDDARRAKGMETAKRDFDLLAQIGGKRLAAPPAGATDRPDLDLLKAAERYRALADLGAGFGIAPMVEVWGFSKCLNRLGQAAEVAIESGHPNACILADVYHLYKGGSGFEGLKLLSGNSMHVLHVNDYPAQPPRETITDADRVYPGDGIAPLKTIFRTLRDIGYTGALSVELFNPSYYKQDPLTVAKTALEKTRAAVQSALNG